MTQAPTRRRASERSARTAVRGPGSRMRLVAGSRLFGRYRLERRIGRGGTAEVWRAHDERLDRTVAVKVFHRHLLPDAPSTRRFVAEARAAAGLTHPAIVPVFDVVEDPETPAIVFRYVDGETLADRVTRLGPMAPTAAAAIAADLASALDHAHRVGLVHRDVKPANVLVDLDGRALLVDFGIARALAGRDDRETASGDIVGTLRYMAPEQLAGRPTDARTDLYALGLVLYELLAGRPAFGAASPAALVDSQRDGPPPPPSGTPAPLAAILADLLAADPADRPADAASVEPRLRAASTPGVLTSPLADGPPSEGRPKVVSDPDADGPEADTLAFEAPPTVAIPFPPQPAHPRGDTPGAARSRTASVRAVPAPARRRRPGAVVVGGALAGIGVVVLAIAALGAGLGDAPAAVTRAGPTGTVGATASPLVDVTAAPKAGKPPHGRGHGRNGDGG